MNFGLEFNPALSLLLADLITLVTRNKGYTKFILTE